jgi:hypothetical protein
MLEKLDLIREVFGDMAKIIPVFTGDIINGGILKVSPQVKREMALWYGTFKPGTQVDIIVRKHKKERTDLQNKYYWPVVVGILADYFGYESEEMHEELKAMFNPVESKLQPGKRIGGSTANLSTEDFFSTNNDQSYIERIRRWASLEHSVFIPDPDKSYKD